MHHGVKRVIKAECAPLCGGLFDGFDRADFVLKSVLVIVLEGQREDDRALNQRADRLRVQFRTIRSVLHPKRGVEKDRDIPLEVGGVLILGLLERVVFADLIPGVDWVTRVGFDLLPRREDHNEVVTGLCFVRFDLGFFDSKEILALGEARHVCAGFGHVDFER